ncbi:MAG: hypothetical protein U5R06_05665 [candidate division KSB1 bacterium]|nr:hypothetical protein [candidate division KSB1 bacterium]
MKNIVLIISVLLLTGCSETSDNHAISNREHSIKYPAKTALTMSILDTLGPLREYKRSEYILYCKRDSYSERHIEGLLIQIEEAILRIKTLLEMDRLSKGVHLIMLDSREEMGRLFGHNYKGLSIRKDDLALFVYNSETRPYFRHELFHLMAYRVWGDSKTRLLNEGGAMYADNRCLSYENPIIVINKYLLETHKWFDFQDLVTDFQEKVSKNDLIAYFQSYTLHDA